MTIQLNGQSRAMSESGTIRILLAELKLSPDKVAVELNRRLVRGEAFDRPLAEGDEVEVVTFVGGG